MKNIDSFSHTRGQSIYVDDIPLQEGTLFGACFGSPFAHGRIESLDVSEALSMPGVKYIFTYKDVDGENQIGGIVQDEPLFAEDIVDFCGMPVAFVVAENDEIARAAVKKIKIEISPLHIVTDPREAQLAGKLIVPPRTFTLGNTEDAWIQCTHIIEGTVNTNGQEHLYIETQGAYAIPQENDSIKLYSSTQSPRATQFAASRTTGIPMHRMEVDVTRLGGGFGGKEDQANAWAAMCALAAKKLKRPVKYVLSRIDDMAMTGKRHPYTTDFKIGVNADYKIVAFEAVYYQNAGATADLSPAIMERTLFHCTNTYYIPNVKATAYSCRTNLPSNTAFRGFGGPQAMFVIEAAITKVAEKTGVDATLIQKNNLIKTGEVFPYGQKAVSEASACWTKAEKIYKLDLIKQEVNQFNMENELMKKGISIMPVCFGISFTNTAMNQARALVHIYTDGSVSISTGAIEMGQGVNTKMLQVAAEVFSLPASKIKLHTTNTSRIANSSPSAASATADLNGKAVLMACNALSDRLKQVAASELNSLPDTIHFKNGVVCINDEPTELSWDKLVNNAYWKRVNLSEHAHYITPEVHFDKSTEKGHPFAYHVYGTAITIVSLDCIRGTYSFDAVKIVHDFGKSMNRDIDRGQIEGGLVQGIGWMTLEEIVYDKNGKLKSNALSTYKVPDVYSVPKKIDIDFLDTDNNNLAIFNSKAVGEPPLMYGIGAYFAIRNAIRAFNHDASIPFDAPMTPEKALMALYSAKKSSKTLQHGLAISDTE